MHAAHPWGSSTGRHAVVARIWQDWHAWTSHPTSTVAAIPWERDIGMKPDLSGGKSNSIRGSKGCCGCADANLKGADFRGADTWNAHFTLGQFPRTRPTAPTTQ